ncbi:MAG: Wzz/FepE/Etk N-terminal domain-containing protein, partial [Pseudomonadota bacterium]
MDQVSALRELWSMFRRRLPILLVIGTIGASCSAFIAYILPPVYQSQARILVESQQIPSELARSTVTASAAERLQLIQQRLMTRDNLLRLIDDLGLFADRPDLTLSEKIGLIRAATEIEPVELVVDRRRRKFTAGQISAFTITITFNNAAEAAKIANEFVTTVLDQNLRARTERASETLTFFEQEEERISGALNALEVEITSYKS